MTSTRQTSPSHDDSAQASLTSGESRNRFERYLMYRRASTFSWTPEVNPSMPFSSSLMRPLPLSTRIQSFSSPALTSSTSSSSPFSSSSVSMTSVYPESPFMLPSASLSSSVPLLTEAHLGESDNVEERIFFGILSSESKLPSMSSSDSNMPSDTAIVPRKVGACLSLLSREARRENDAMVYLEGPQIYSCIHCRTHLTTHDDIISKSFHGRHGRAYLFENCANIELGPAEDRRLITGLHSVCDISCKRCKTLIGWTYVKAYEHSQKYKEGKFIVEKINLFLEESRYYYSPPAGERRDHWILHSMS